MTTVLEQALFFPRIQDLNLRISEVTDVARDDGQIVVKRGRRQQTVNDRQSFAFSLGVGRDQTPTIRNRRVNRHDSSRKSGLQLNLEPRFQMCPALSLSKARQTLANFSNGQNAEIEDPFVRSLHPLNDAGIGLRTNKLGNTVRIEKESAHSSISRPVSLSLSKSRSTPTSGDSRKNWTILFGWRDLTIRRSYCSSEIMTTPSLPCRVIRCGPMDRASRNTSLKRALAVCTCQACSPILAMVRLAGFTSRLDFFRIWGIFSFP